MPVVATCTHCSGKVKVKDELAGKSVKCPKCAKPVKVPAQPTETAVAEMPAPPAPKAKTTLPKAAPPPLPPPPPEKKKKAAWEKDVDDEESEDEETFSVNDIAKKSKSKKKDDDDDDGEDSFSAMLEATTAPDAIKLRVREELGLKEYGVWVNQPVPKIMMVRAIPKVFIAMFVTCFLSVFAGVGLMGGLGLKPIIGIPILIALDLFAVIFWAVIIVFMDRRAALSTVYVVTNKRCIVVSGRWFFAPNIESFYPELLVHLRRRSSWFFGSNAGDIVFRSVTTITHHSKGGTSSSTVYYGFLGVSNMDESEDMIRNTLLRDDDDDDDDDEEDERRRRKKKRKNDRQRDEYDD